MKKILVYGDSNTWGDNFITGMRIPDDRQWVNILREKYQDKFIFLQEGLPGRIAGNEECEKKYKNGKDSFISTFRVNAPVDIVIISLGTNDLQKKYNKSSEQIINDLNWYREQLILSFNDLEDRKKYFKNNKLPDIIYILPINFDYKDQASVIFDQISENKRQDIINYFTKQEESIEVIYSNDLPLFEDGIHLNYCGHEEMSKLVESVLKEYE